MALGLLVAGLAGLIFGLPQLMPACFNRFERGLPAVIVSRGLLAGAFVGGEAFVPLMLVEEREVALVLAGAALTVGSVGWMTGSWLQSRPWLKIRRDRLITFGCLSLTLGLGSTGLVAFLPEVPYYLVAAGWIFSGLGMGLATASTSLAVMTLVRAGGSGPERVLVESLRCVGRRVVRRRVRDHFRGAARRHRALRDLRCGARGR